MFFDDTRVEVFGPGFDNANINYDGDLALSWRTIWLEANWVRPTM